MRIFGPLSCVRPARRAHRIAMMGDAMDHGDDAPDARGARNVTGGSPVAGRVRPSARMVALLPWRDTVPPWCFLGALLSFALVAQPPPDLRSDAAITFYVSCSEGDDGAAGSLAAPFRSLTRARDATRAARGRQGLSAAVAPAEIFIRGGVCQLAEPLQLNASDSAVVWGAYQSESVLISAGLTVPPELLTHPSSNGGFSL